MAFSCLVGFLRLLDGLKRMEVKFWINEFFSVFSFSFPNSVKVFFIGE